MRRTMTLALAALFAIAAFSAPTGYKILKEIKVGGDGGWDYLTMDSDARRLYLSHTNMVAVVDPDAVVVDLPPLDRQELEIVVAAEGEREIPGDGDQGRVLLVRCQHPSRLVRIA